jgi:hypothetical protein
VLDLLWYDLRVATRCRFLRSRRLERLLNPHAGTVVVKEGSSVRGITRVSDVEGHG